eukprot:gene7059-7273_t
MANAHSAATVTQQKEAKLQQLKEHERNQVARLKRLRQLRHLQQLTEEQKQVAALYATNSTVPGTTEEFIKRQHQQHRRREQAEKRQQATATQRRLHAIREIAAQQREAARQHQQQLSAGEASNWRPEKSWKDVLAASPESSLESLPDADSHLQQQQQHSSVALTGYSGQGLKRHAALSESEDDAEDISVPASPSKPAAATAPAAADVSSSTEFPTPGAFTGRLEEHSYYIGGEVTDSEEEQEPEEQQPAAMGLATQQGATADPATAAAAPAAAGWHTDTAKDPQHPLARPADAADGGMGKATGGSVGLATDDKQSMWQQQGVSPAAVSRQTLEEHDGGDYACLQQQQQQQRHYQVGGDRRLLAAAHLASLW